MSNQRTTGRKQAASRRTSPGSDGNAPPPALSPGELAGARKGALPVDLSPQLATLAREAPAGDEWLHEIKYDGYRILCHVAGSNVRLVTRNGNDWTTRFAPIASAVAELGLGEVVLDGEVVAIGEDGQVSFHALQNHLEKRTETQLMYYVFDLVFVAGYDLRKCALIDRKQALRTLLANVPADSAVRYGDHIEGNGPEVFARACEMKVEGIVSKLARSTYVSTRSRSWLKIKCSQAQQFVVVGYTLPEGGRAGFSALLLGHYQGANLVYAGRVGTGFTERHLQDLRAALEPLMVERAPTTPASTVQEQGARWVTPSIVVEITFAEWTPDGRLRHPSFQGLAVNRSPADLRRESTG